MSVGADAGDRAASEADPVQALNLPQESAELGLEITRVQAEMERGIQLGGLKNDPTLPLVRTLATSLGLQWRLHNQAVTYFRSVSDRLDLQLTQTIRQSELALETRRSAIVQTLARSCPEAWCSNRVAEQGWLLDQAARGGRLTARSSLSGAMVSRLM